MGQKQVTVYNETSRPIEISNWALVTRSSTEIEPNSVSELFGDQCHYSVVVRDDDKRLIKHGVHFPSIEWLIYYQDQKHICHLLQGKGDVPLDLINCFSFYEIPDENDNNYDL